MSVKIYGSPFSTCTRRVLTTLEEKNVPYEISPIDLTKGEHKTPDFLALQPFGVIPVLEDGDVRLFESRAIIRYIAKKWKGQGTDLYGKTEKDEALTEQWLEVEGQNFNPPVSSAVAQKFFIPVFGKGQADEEVVKKNVAALEKVLDVYEAHLAKNQYLAGDFFSLADISHLPYLDYYLTKTGLEDPLASRPSVKAWWERITSRPSWKKVIGA